MKKRLLSLTLALIMVLGLLPATAFAGTGDTVYISAAHDGRYLDGMVYAPVSLATLKAIDLDAYGLGDFCYDGDGDGMNDITALHLVIYAHTVLQQNDWDDVRVSGYPGAIFFEGGLFGFADCNLNYYVNGEYPAVDGWGVTMDQCVLSPGDFVDFAAYSSWSFFGDSASGFHYFMDGNQITHSYEAVAGQSLTVKLGRTSGGLGGETLLNEEPGYTVFYDKTLFESNAASAATNDYGEIKLTFAEAGTYYLWADGAYGNEDPLSVVSSPAFAKVTVTAPACDHRWTDATCKDPKTCSVCGETEGEADPEAHKYVSGKCEHCGAAEPVATPSYTIKLSEAEELTSGLNYFISVPAEVLGKDIIFDFGSGTIKGAMCQRHCSKRDIWTAGEGSTMLIAADKVAAHLCNESQRAKVASDFNLYLTEGSQMFAFYWWTSANMNGSYIYIEILPAEGGDGEDATYTVTLPTNNVGFSVRATSSPTVTAGGEFSFKLNIYDDYKRGENFKVKANGVDLTSSGDTYTITNITANQTVTVEGVVEKTLAEKNVTVNAPAGSVVSSGAFHSYFKYDFVEPLQISTLEDGRVQYIVPATSGAGGFIRVQNPNGVTYWDFGDLAIGKVFNITEEMLFIGNTEYTKDTVFANYEKNGHDTASLYLTVNAQGWLDMDTGDTHSLNVFRNWIPVSNSTTNTGVSLPDVTYTVVDVNGNASDVVTVTPDTNNSCYADIKAVKAGTAIILVSYDAVYNADGEGGKQFSAIWPENTGVIVVTVDADDANIQTNITVNEEANAGGKQILDVEHDILFYVGDEGAEYSFKPEAGCTVTISRSTVGNEMTFNGFTNEGVTVSEDGTVTLSGLTTGAHIVKVEKDGKTAYQVIRAREVSYKLTHSDGTEVTAENPAQPGETITVQFSKLIDPMGKLSGVYNAKYGFRYTGENGDVITIASTSAYGEYYFGSNPARQRFSVTVPAEWDSITYTLTDGGIALDGWGSSFGAHRSTTYMEGKEPNLNASGTAGVASVLPDVVIPVYVETKEEPTSTWQEILTKTKAYLIAQAENKAPTVGSTKGEWQVLGLARDGVSGSFYEAYFAAAKAYIAENADENGKLHANKSTDNSRLILALTALGKDVTDVDGHNLLSGLSDLDYVKKQGINGPIFALIALDSHDYVPAANATATREALINYILSKELSGGGWALSGQTPDDMTPMAVQALAPYYDTNAAVKAAVDKALTVMETMTATTETYAQIIVARSALGLDSADAMGKMLAFALEDGSFEKASGSGANQMSTEQAFYAMVAYSRYLAGENALYDMTDVTVQPEQPASAEAVKAAMEALEVEQADKATYTAIQTVLDAYSKLTREEKAAIADTYEDFLNKEEDFEDLLKDAIDDAKLDLEDLYEDLDSEDYTEDSWDEIRALYRDCRDTMKKARYIEELEELLDQFEEDVDNILVGAMEVTFRLIGDWQHEGDVSDHEEYVTWVKTTEYTLPAESTVYDLLMEALEEYDLSQKGASKNYVESIQAPDVLGGYWLGEFDNGPNSGWMYTINGDHPGTGLKDHELEDGDEVIWHYVDDFTLEQRKPSSKYYERWLEAEDITPETYIKRNLDNIVTVEGKGEVKPDLKTSHIGKDVKFTFTPAEGWVIQAVYVDGKNKGAVETFTYKDLAMDARIEVVFAQNTAFRMDFVDVPQSEWFYNDVYFAVSNGLFNGVDEDTFAPGASMTRAMLVTVLYRLEGQPAVYGGSPFADVAAGQWYTDAVIWASRKGIVNGLGNGKFGVDDNITREQMAAILYRYAQNCGYNTAARAYLSGYSDAARIGGYAQEAMAWANAMGLINGRTATTLAPDGTATRAEVAAIFHRFVENIAE